MKVMQPHIYRFKLQHTNGGSFHEDHAILILEQALDHQKLSTSYRHLLYSSQFSSMSLTIFKGVLILRLADGSENRSENHSSTVCGPGIS